MNQSDQEKQVEVFNYLSVVTSIILGLGFGHLLTGYARLIHTLQSLSSSYLYIGWAVLLLPVYVMYWWAFWDYRKQVRWTFTGFLFLLIGPIGLYFITALLLPGENGQVPLDFNADRHYLSIRIWTFGVWTVLQVWGIMLSPWLKDGFTKASFFNRYKYAQYILLVALAAGLVGACVCKRVFMLDAAILFIFWIVLIYLLAGHRRTIQAK